MDKQDANYEPYFPEPKVHEYLCDKHIIAGNPTIAPAIYLWDLTTEQINILFTSRQAKIHCGKECGTESCKEIKALFDKKRIQPTAQTLYWNR